MANQLGAYQIIEEIGRGGMGTVYRAMDTRLQRPVALKVLSGDLESEAVMIERFQREARALARVRHPNLINIYNVDRHGGTHYFAMELINGHPVSDLTREENELPIEEVLDIVEQVLPALSAIHRVGLVHRDIKPGTVSYTHLRAHET